MSHEALTLVAGPVGDAVDVAALKKWCRVDLAADDDLFAGLVAAVGEVIGETHDCTLLQCSWRLTLDCFPGHDWGRASQGRPVPQVQGLPSYGGWGEAPDWLAIRLRRGPLVSVTSLSYVAADGTATTLDASLYQVVTSGGVGRVVPAYGRVWPVARWQPGAVTVDYVAGYASEAELPARAATALKFGVAWLYEHRGDGVSTADLPKAFDWLLAPFGSGRYS